MADSIKIGNLDISAFKVGSSDCKIYLGDTLLYPQSPTPPTPTLKWVSYSEGDTVPSKLFYGVKLGDPNMEEASIEFGDVYNTGVAFTFDINSEYGWSAQDLSGEIDITQYYDETEGCYIIYFSDLGYGAMPLYIPTPSDSFEFDVQLYEEHTTTLQWVTFNTSDRIPTTLNIYGVKGNAYDLSNALVTWFTASKANVDISINGCYSDTVSMSDNVELIFSELGTCSDYYNLEFEQVVYSGSIQLLIIP